MAKFLIRYVEPNLAEETWREVTAEFEDWKGRATLCGKEFGRVMFISARKWAEDAADALADGGRYEVIRLD